MVDNVDNAGGLGLGFKGCKARCHELGEGVHDHEDGLQEAPCAPVLPSLQCDPWAGAAHRRQHEEVPPDGEVRAARHCQRANLDPWTQRLAAISRSYTQLCIAMRRWPEAPRGSPRLSPDGRGSQAWGQGDTNWPHDSRPSPCSSSLHLRRYVSLRVATCPAGEMWGPMWKSQQPIRFSRTSSLCPKTMSGPDKKPATSPARLS